MTRVRGRARVMGRARGVGSGLPRGLSPESLIMMAIIMALGTARVALGTARVYNDGTRFG